MASPTTRWLSLALALVSCRAPAPPPVPKLTSVEVVRGAGMPSVRVRGQAAPGTMIELYLSPDCRGIPRAAAPSPLLAAGLELPLPQTSAKVMVYALARDPERGASSCSDGLVVALPAPPPQQSWQDLGLDSAGDERDLWKRVLAAQELLRQSIPARAWAKLAHDAPGFVPVGTLSLSLGKEPRFLTPDLNGDGAPDYAVLGVSRSTALGAAVSSGETKAAPGPLLLELRNLRTVGGAQLELGLSSAQGTSWVALPGGSGLTLVPGWAARADQLPGCDLALAARADLAWARAHRCDALELDGSDTDPVRYLIWDQRTRAVISLEDQCEAAP